MGNDLGCFCKVRRMHRTFLLVIKRFFNRGQFRRPDFVLALRKRMPNNAPNILALPGCASIIRHYEVPHHEASTGGVWFVDAFRATSAIQSGKCLSPRAGSKYRWVMRCCGRAVVNTIQLWVAVSVRHPAIGVAVAYMRNDDVPYALTLTK